MKKINELNTREINKKFSERSSWSNLRKDLKEDSSKPESSAEVEEDSIRVVIGFDFGTTYSGFAYCHVTEKQNLRSNDLWHGERGQLKTNTVLQYDDKYNQVKLWGAPALAKKPNRRDTTQNENKPVELFKLHLGDMLDNFKPNLPVDYKKAITDYFREIGKIIKDTVTAQWSKIDYFKHVLLVITVPAEFSEKSKAIMRICAHNADLIKEECSANLQFTTEPEAAAVFCMENSLSEHGLAQPGINFMIVDCGGGTVDLTTRKLINDKQLGEVTERAGDFCGSTFVDDEFLKYLRRKVGDKPMDSLKEKNYGRMQYLVQQFCNSGKIPFMGDDPSFL
ncbi:6626_t:CDS:2, partial [Funneliformis geosporum]